MASLWLLELGGVTEIWPAHTCQPPKIPGRCPSLRDVSYSVCRASRVTVETFLFFQPKHPAIGVLEKYLLSEMPCGQCCEGGRGVIIAGGK